jgi:hypothetical protein
VRPFAAGPALLVLLLVAAPVRGAAFRKVVAGEAIPDRTMPTLDGKRAPLLPAGKVNVFVFVRTGHDHSESALRQLAQLERELAAKPVRFVVVVSSGEAPDDVARLVQESGLRAPVLVDEDDALYGDLGVAMYPSAGIVRPDRRLSGFQPFRKVNYLDAMRGRVRFALGELDEAGLAKVLDPDAAPIASGGRWHARMSLARKLLRAGDMKGAIANARASLTLDPAQPEAHAVLAEALGKAGECDEAEREAGIAKKLAPSEPAPATGCPPR